MKRLTLMLGLALCAMLATTSTGNATGQTAGDRINFLLNTNTSPAGATSATTVDHATVTNLSDLSCATAGPGGAGTVSTSSDIGRDHSLYSMHDTNDATIRAAAKLAGGSKIDSSTGSAGSTTS